MKHRTNKLTVLASAIAISLAMIVSSTPLTLLASAQTPNRAVAVQVRQDMQARIKRDGRLSNAAYRSLLNTRFGNVKTVRANRFAAGSSPGNTVTQVGDQPPGFGQTFFWDRKDDQALLVAFINAADNLGMSIEGMQSGDTIEIRSAAGLASFSEDQGNPEAASFVGLLATAAEGAALYEESPQYLPIIRDAESKAKDLFKATGEKGKIRDAYGIEPSSGGKARAEGGIIICLPQSGGPYYSGDPDHQNRWIKPDGTRDLAHMPDHIFSGTAFFPLRGNDSQNRQLVTKDGEVYVLPWDSAFADNAGFYKVFIVLHKGNGPVDPGPILIKKGQGSGGGSRVSDGTHRVKQ